jgi:hypothetical protein
MGWTTEGLEFEFRYIQEFLFLPVQTGSGVHPASYPLGTGGEADHSRPASAEAKKMWIDTSPIRLEGQLYVSLMFIIDATEPVLCSDGVYW